MLSIADIALTREQIEERLARRLTKGDGCWEWNGAGTKDGQPVITLDKRGFCVYRVTYELWVGPIPEGMWLVRRCRNVRCANPAHIDVLTPSEGTLAGVPYRKPRPDIKKRLLSKRHVNELGCWEWTGSLFPKEYGATTYQGRTRPVHRLAYELWVGPIPDGFQVDHLCSNRRCFNPEHLEAVDPKEHGRRTASRKVVTHCKRGHLFDEANTWIRHEKGGPKRICLECKRAWGRHYTAKLKQQVKAPVIQFKLDFSG